MKEKSRWLTLSSVLLAICLMNTNNYFGYHAPSAVSNLYEQQYKLGPEQFGTLFTIYSAPNIILAFISGVIIDQYGVIFASILYNSLILIGLIICAIAPIPLDDNSVSKDVTYAYLLIGRLFLGLGGESIVACASTIIAKWFTSRSLNTAMSINQAAVQLFGSSAAFYILPRFHSLAFAQWFTVFVGLVSLLASFVYGYLEHSHQIYFLRISSQVYLVDREGDAPLSASCSSVVESYETFPLIDGSLTHTEHETNNAVISTYVSSDDYSDKWLQFPLLFWLTTFHVALVSPILYTFTAFGPLYLLDNFPCFQSEEQAGDAISLLYLGIVLAPLTGMAIDRIGHRVLVQLFAVANILLLLIALKCYPSIDPYSCLFYMGFMFSVTESNSLAIVSYVIPREKLGTAYGIGACFISVALLVEPTVVGYLRAQSGSFASSLSMFIALVAVGCAFCVLMYMVQRRDGRVF